jgi:hypothetical protein
LAWPAPLDSADIPLQGVAMARPTLVRAIAAALLVAPTAWLLMGATPVDRFRDDPDRLVFVTAHWKDRAQLQQIAGRFQHVTVDEAARTARTEASADDLIALRRMGVRVEIDDAATQKMRDNEQALADANSLVVANAIPGYSCYRTVEETYATMDNLAAIVPDKASVIDIGPSWIAAHTGGAQGYRMKVLRINNSATDASIPSKPNMVIVAALHAREYTTAELVTRFSEWLLGGYNVDPDATWLVDNFRFHFILQSNPDGRKKAESGISWRKNVDTANGVCSANAYGVDLNRNFPWRWRTVAGGSSGDACASNYRGTAALSEDETANILRYVVGTPSSSGVYTGGVLADQRTDTGTAPSTYRGMFLDIHSYSRLVLWPWSYTSTTPPNSTALRTLGRRLAYFNGYKPQQWIGLYAADGTVTDTVYGITGAPSYTIELGQAFFESCSTFESTTYPRNFDALKYAARSLYAPYNYPGGPDTTSIGASATSVRRGQAFAVSAWVDDARFNQSNGTEAVQNIANVRAYVDTRPWVGGAAYRSMTPSDGSFNSAREQATTNIPTTNLALGKHVVFVRGTDASGKPGTPRAIYFDVTP